MTIVSSVVAIDQAQPDGTRLITERHVDNLGVAYQVCYTAPSAQWNAGAALSGHAATLATAATQAEIAGNVAVVCGGGSAVTFNYCARSDFLAALGTTFAQTNGSALVYLAAYLSGLSDADVMTAFGYTSTQVSTVRTNKLTPAANSVQTLQTALG